MAKRKTSKRTRSRKPTAQRVGQDSGQHATPPTAGVATPDRPPAERASVGQRSSGAPRRRARDRSRAAGANERPHAPWHPLPLSELLILVGAIGVVLAWKRGVEGSPALLVASILAVAVGTIEVTLREHLGGYRSHALLLALIPVVVLHSSALLVPAAFTTVPRWVNIPLLAIDIALFALLYKLLRLRYLDAERERRFS